MPSRTDGAQVSDADRVLAQASGMVSVLRSRSHDALDLIETRAQTMAWTVAPVADALVERRLRFARRPRGRLRLAAEERGKLVGVACTGRCWLFGAEHGSVWRAKRGLEELLRSDEQLSRQIGSEVAALACGSRQIPAVCTSSGSTSTLNDSNQESAPHEVVVTAHDLLRR